MTGNNIRFVCTVVSPTPVAGRSKGVGLWPFACWDCWFEYRRGHGCLSVVSVVYCQVVSATSWSFVQRSRDECVCVCGCVIKCDLEASIMRNSWPTRDFQPWGKFIFSFGDLTLLSLTLTLKYVNFILWNIFFSWIFYTQKSPTMKFKE